MSMGWNRCALLVPMLSRSVWHWTRADDLLHALAEKKNGRQTRPNVRVMPLATNTRKMGKVSQAGRICRCWQAFFPEIQRILRPFSDDVFTEEGRITLFAVALWPGLHSGAAPVFLNRVTGVNWVEWVCSLPSLSNPEVCGVSAGMWHFRSLLLCLVVFPGSRKTTVPESLSPDERE